MSAFVESLKRLYSSGKISESNVISLFSNGKITSEEKEYILCS